MFIGKHIQLRSLKLKDAKAIVQVYNSLEARRFLDDPAPLSLVDAEQWIRKTWEQRKAHHNFFFAIELRNSKELLGVCGLFGLQKINRKAELMITLFDESNRNQGHGTEALQLLLDYGFNQLNLHRIVLFTHEINKRAQQVYEKIGFKPGGRRRQASFFEGAYHDLLLYDMLDSEFRGT
ncbi:MAG: GNAT family N-acetyltransferase [Candidatus Hermodarchaeia archaeon]|jgi:RimJ/RimL family protein N-acetyltransferase